MFNYGAKWSKELDNELHLGVMAGWSVERIAENIGKTYGQVRYRINELRNIKAKERKRNKILAETGSKLNKDGSINYTSHLKFGD